MVSRQVKRRERQAGNLAWAVLRGADDGDTASLPDLRLRSAAPRLAVIASKVGSQMRIERQEEDLLSGMFVPGPAFPRVEQLFHEFEAAVEVQALHVIETLDATIAALGLHLQWPDAREPITVQDVQIWSDGSITCRLCSQSTAPVNINL